MRATAQPATARPAANRPQPQVEGQDPPTPRGIPQVDIDKEADGGRWLLSYALNGRTVLRLRVSVGGPWDWHIFSAEVQPCGEYPSVVGTFDIAPAALLPASGEPPWDPADERELQRLPRRYREAFAVMVRQWGHVMECVLPSPAWRMIH